MSHRRLVLLLIVLVGATPAAAQDDVDGQLWTQAVATLRPADDWRLHLEFQPRWYRDVSESYQIITRAAAGRVLSARVTLWGGYAWIAKPPGPGTSHEQRVWEQLSVSLPAAGAWSPSLRIRIEQRFQDAWSDSSHRIRVLGRVARPLGQARRWSLGLSEELHVTADRTTGGPRRGLDQNRVAATVTRRFSSALATEMGYQWVAAKTSTGRTTDAHVGLFTVQITP